MNKTQCEECKKYERLLKQAAANKKNDPQYYAQLQHDYYEHLATHASESQIYNHNN